MRIINSNDVEFDNVAKLLNKKSFDEVELSPKIREANKKIFGADLTAVEIVHKIVDEVRQRGDSAVIEYTKKIDGIELSIEDFIVKQSEFISKQRFYPK